MSRDDLLSILGKLKERILDIEKNSFQISEQDTRQGLINPLFRSLGWDFSDFSAVKSELRHKSYNDPVDYAFFHSKDKEKPVLLVEAKALGKNLNDSKIVKQLCTYLGEMGVQWGLLTDGNKYIMYNSNAGMSFDDQKFLTMQIKTADTADGLPSSELADKLTALLSRVCLEDGNVQKFYESHTINRHIEDALWSLLTEPFDTLAAAIRKEFKQERVKVDSRLRITTQQIVSYLETLKDEDGRVLFTIEDDVRETDDSVLQSVVQSQVEGSELVSGRTKRVTILDLLQAGLIAEGDSWRFGYKGEFTWGRITGNGEIEVNGATYTSPSKAGCANSNMSSCHGWLFWFYKDNTGEWHRVNILRERYRANQGMMPSGGRRT